MTTFYFEIGGRIIESNADYEYAIGKTSAQQRNIHRKMAKDFRQIEKVPKMVFPTSSKSSDDGMGTYETVGHYAGLAAGVYFGVVTFPVTQLDSPLIGPADLAWLGATIRMTSKFQWLGRELGSKLD